MIRIAIVDDKLRNRRMVMEKLAVNPFFSVVLEAEDGSAFLDKIQAIHPDDLPHIVLMDLEMPHINGVAAIATASSLYPGIRFVVLTVFDDEEKIFQAIKAGASGYLLKEESGEVLAEMLLSLWESGAGPISPSIAYKILQMLQTKDPAQKTEQPDIFRLSQREKEILELLAGGFEYKEIADKLFISPNTVKKHCISIYQKLHVSNRTQAVKIAYAKGLV
ncbi:LuxR C-terminal-related transcriptional regulator [Leadbetterella sp. DM7]|uniref:LuxR C-terminal-related transcriptional regulator n=1 Tax=Leadbetterella sp. DM7 TaxID=3235085 RepID=UPI00349E834D